MEEFHEEFNEKSSGGEMICDITHMEEEKKEEIHNSDLITTIELQQKLLYEAIVNDNICEVERLLIEAPIDIITPLDIYKDEVVRLLIERATALDIRYEVCSYNYSAEDFTYLCI